MKVVLRGDVVDYLETGELVVDLLTGIDTDGRPMLQQITIDESAVLVRSAQLRGQHPASGCPFCGGADLLVESDDTVAVYRPTGYDPDNGPTYQAVCQQCGAHGPVVGFAADAVPACGRRGDAVDWINRASRG